jgi:uncharacterized protein (TIGR00297 family)
MQLPIWQPFINEWYTFALFLLFIFILIGISEVARSMLQWSPESSRKLVHLIVGTLVSACPFIFKSNIPPVFLAGVFIFVNALALKTKKFKGMHSTDRASYGTVYFPIAFLILALFWWEKPITLILSMLIMTFSDTIAAVIGERTPQPRNFRIWDDIKSIEGCLGMFLSSFIIIYIGTDLFAWLFGAAFFIPLPILIGTSGFVAMIVTLSEAVSSKGSDNFTVPIMTALSYDIFLINYTHGTLNHLLFWAITSAIVFYGAYKFKSLSKSGVLSAYVMGIIIFGTGGFMWIVPILTFFVLSSALSILPKTENTLEKNPRRDIIQVIANGGAATIISVINFYSPNNLLFIVYLAAIAAATADTWASEIGLLSPWNPIHITKLKSVIKGTSGGISLLGTLGSVLGATVIGITGVQLGLPASLLGIIVFTGTAGGLVDSVIGGSIQATFQCTDCNDITEKRKHCNLPSMHVSGLYILDNDMVNFLNTISGIIIVLILV